MIRTYIKKPVKIQAVQWVGTNLQELESFIEKGKFKVVGKSVDIDTLEGTMRASLNDFIIKGVEGEFCPCKPDIFKKTYQLI